MKNENRMTVAIAGLSLLLSSAAIAGASPAGQPEKGGDTTPEMTRTLTLENLIRENTEKKRMADTAKYAQITTLAGDKKNELEKRMADVTNTYKIWRDLKLAVESSHSTNPNNFKAIEVAAQAYAQANKAFIDLQKDILAKNGVPSAEINARIVMDVVPPNAVDAFNAAPATAAGSK